MEGFFLIQKCQMSQSIRIVRINLDGFFQAVPRYPMRLVRMNCYVGVPSKYTVIREQAIRGTSASLLQTDVNDYARSSRESCGNAFGDFSLDIKEVSSIEFAVVSLCPQLGVVS
jgi:hypothetical protein